MSVQRLLFSLTLLLTALPVWAGLIDGVNGHNLSYLGGEPCAYCHSVHNSVGGMGRPAYMGASLPSITLIYNSLTLDHGITETSVANSDAPLCLTCHDSGFVGTMTDATIKSTLLAKIGVSPADPVLAQRDIGVDLRNDHPVGFVFNAALDPTGLKNPNFTRIHVTFGPGYNEMWCSTCHNPHDNTYPPLLSTSNAGSAMCLDCHTK